MVHRINKIIMHAGFCLSDLKNDVALLRLAIPVNLDSKVGTVCLPKAGSRVIPGTKCWISGLDDFFNQYRQYQQVQK